MKYISAIALLAFMMIGCNSPAQKSQKISDNSYKIAKTDAEWKAQLAPATYNVMRKQGTERAFSSKLNDNYQAGTYVCAACGTPLYESSHKFDSGTGWPSFDRTIEGNVAFSAQKQMGYTLTEEHCANCGGHLGHVFDDGPKETTGKRHCINGVALKFIPKDGQSK